MESARHSDAARATLSWMRIEFRAYADDYTVRGELDLQGERLADYLVDADQIEIDTVVVTALDDGREHELPSAVIRRDELCVVAATGPRGRSDRRVRTRAYPMRIEVGAYALVGYFQAPRLVEPGLAAMQREIIALSAASLVYTVAGERIEESHDALLVIRAKMTRFDPATDTDLGLAQVLDVSGEVDSGAKDFTGDIRSGSSETEDE
jgi:hypothetical protein